VEEIVAFLHHGPERYDLFIATDVLIYLGDLQPLFAATASKATPDALFCLSTERTGAADWIVQTTGRYAHHPDYVRKIARENGWQELRSARTDIRREGDGWIEGSLFAFARMGESFPQ
jgi:predicted TPR repeat methyltransferase